MAAVPDKARQAFRILHVGFVVAPILAGLDKFFEVLVDWDRYLARSPRRPARQRPHVHAGRRRDRDRRRVLVAVAPDRRLRGRRLAVGIIVNLLILGDYFDVALRDFGSLGALALARLAEAFPTAGLVPARPACGAA